MTGQEWMGFAGSLLAAAGAIWAAVISIHGNRDTRQIKGQVVNGHKNEPPLRADIDGLKAQGDRTENLLKLLVDRQTEQGRDIGGIREELRVERRERIAGDQR